MKMSGLIVNLILIFFASCQIFQINNDSSFKEIFVFGETVKQNYDLQIIGFGGGCNENKKHFSVTLLGKQHINLDEARALFYDLIETFLKLINLDDNLKLKYINYPFTYDDLDILIIFPNAEGYITGMASSFILDQKPFSLVYFFTYNIELQRPMITYEEKYEQLKNIVESQRQTICN